MEAAAKAGVKKFVLVTSIGTGESKAATPPNVYEVLRPVLVEKEKAEKRLKVSWAALGGDAGGPTAVPTASRLCWQQQSMLAKSSLKVTCCH